MSKQNVASMRAAQSKRYFMLFQEYAPLARVTLKHLPLPDHAIHLGLGVVGEFGELIDAAKKVAIYGKAVDQVNRTEEVGDVAWYIANYCVELGVNPAMLQTSIDLGYTDGMRQKALLATPIDIGAALLGLSLAATSACCQLMGCQPNTFDATKNLAGLANVLGVLCAALDVDPSEAFELNIAKLKARYGDKFSEHAALNRDLGAERRVLEGGDQGPVTH